MLYAVQVATVMMVSSTMFSNASSTASFTSQLRETLTQSRTIIDTWVVHEKKRVDQHVREAKQELRSKQRDIDTTSAQLLALQLQYGCKIANDDALNQSTGSHMIRNDKLSAEQTEFETKIQQQTKKNQSLDLQLTELKKEIKGTVIIYA
jgi:phosphoenolpyruvate-protein kinase (PTS system EI component)